jgi:hypothetical protein
MLYVVLIFKDDIFRSDFMRSFMQFQHHNITSDKLSDHMTLIMYILRSISGSDPGFQVSGADLKKLRRAEGGAENFGVIRVKNHDC